MCSKMKITKSTKNYSACPQIKELLNECDSVLIGAGAGLSVSEGFSYSGKRFEKYFSDFKNKYGFSDMYSVAAFILIKLWKNIGHTGAVIFT